MTGRSGLFRVAPNGAAVEHEQRTVGRKFGGDGAVQSARESKHVGRRVGIEGFDPVLLEVGEEELAAPFLRPV